MGGDRKTMNPNDPMADDEYRTPTYTRTCPCEMTDSERHRKRALRAVGDDAQTELREWAP